MINGFKEKSIYKHADMSGIIFYVKSADKTYNGDYELCIDIIDDRKGDIVLEGQHVYIEHETFDKWIGYGLS